MAIILVEGREEPVEGSTAVSLLNNLLRAGVRISHICGGKAGCGTCRVRILEGMEFCTPMREAERGRLTRADGTVPEGVRLACQTYVRGRVRIKIMAPGIEKKR